MINILKDLDLKQQLINNEFINTISSKKLYNLLGFADGKYSRWIKTNLLDNHFFIENIDYVGVGQTVQGNFTIDYYVSFDTAKHLCMLSKTEQTHKIRRYFIECEKILTTENKIRQRHTARKYLTEERKIQVMNRLNMTDKIQDVYGKDAPQYIYSNYTKLVYKKVFGVSDLKKIKKKFNMTEKETIKDTIKISQNLKDLITNYEYDIHCFLQVEKVKGTSKEECYKLVKQFLQLDK